MEWVRGCGAVCVAILKCVPILWYSSHKRHHQILCSEEAQVTWRDLRGEALTVWTSSQPGLNSQLKSSSTLAVPEGTLWKAYPQAFDCTICAHAMWSREEPFLLSPARIVDLWGKYDYYCFIYATKSGWFVCSKRKWEQGFSEVINRELFLCVSVVCPKSKKLDTGSSEFRSLATCVTWNVSELLLSFLESGDDM